MKTDWDPEIKDKVIRYLAQGGIIEKFARSIGYYFNGVRVGVPLWHLTDGEWLWHGSLHHYIHHMGVGLPPRFLESLAARDYVIPDLGRIPWPPFPEYDVEEWVTWANQVKSNRIKAWLVNLFLKAYGTRREKESKGDMADEGPSDS